jgi:hypothetical protein
MRMLFGLVALVSVILVPWSSLAPALLPNASGSAITPGRIVRKGPGVQLSPSLGLLPVGPGDDMEEPHEFPAGSAAPRMICENGVCRLVTDSDPLSAGELPHENSKLDSVRRRLEGTGASQIRVTRDPNGEWRCACSVPISDSSRFMRRFEVTAGSDEQAVVEATKAVETWMHNRQ